jgi:HEAT repeat protein
MLPNHSSISRRLHLEPSEANTLFLLSFSLFLVIGSTAVIGRTVSRALFLSGLPTQYIPARFLAVTVGVVLTSLLYSRLTGRAHTPILIQFTTLAMLGGLFVFRVFLGTAVAGNLWFLGSFYVFLEIVMALNLVQFWTFASEVINTRRAKRLFPIITGAGNLGSMLAGAAVTVLVPLLGTLDLIYVIIFLLAVNVLLVRKLGRANQGLYELSILPALVTKKSKGKQSNPLGFLRDSPLLVIMTIIVVLITLVVNIVDYQFDLSLKSSFASNTQGLSAFLGSFYFWTGIAGLVLQIFLSGPVMRRFGIAAALMIMPASILTGSFMVLISGAAQWAVTLTRSSDTIFRYTIHDTSFNLLYVPIPNKLRSQARAVIDGIFKPLTIGLSGVLFFLVGRISGIAILPWSYVAILVVVAVGVILLRLRRVYMKTLHASIHRRYFDPAGELLDLNNPATVEIIKESLNEPDEAMVLHALALADEIVNVDWTPALLCLIDHDSPCVRRQALRMLGHTQAPEFADLVRKRFADPESDVRASAISTYWALRGEEAQEEMRPFMRDPDLTIKSMAVSGALRYGEEATKRTARAEFVAMVIDPQPVVRISAARALGEMPSEDSVIFLSTLLKDSDPQVRREAMHSVGQIVDPTHLPEAIAQLGDPIVGPAAEEALVRYGIQIFPFLETIYVELAPNLTIRRHIPGVIARIHSPQSVRFLMKNLDEPDDLARSRLYIALGRLRQADIPFLDSDLAAINQRFERETRLAYQWAVRASRPRPESPSKRELLDDAYYWRRRYAVDRQLYLIAILYPQANIVQVHNNLFGWDQRRGANAIELLDMLLSRPHKELFLPLLESSPERIMEIAESEYRLKPPLVEAEFAASVEGNDPWLAACILFSLSRRQVDEIPDLIRQGLNSPHALVHETAQLASTQLFQPEEHQIASPAFVEHAHHSQPPSPDHPYLQSQTIEPEGATVMSITTMERTLLLKRVQLFNEIPAQQLELVARLCSVQYFAPGERLISQGEAPDRLFILVAGEVEVSTDDLEVIDRRKEGEIIGEIGVLANLVRTANCTAVGETTALCISQADLWDLLERNAMLSSIFIRILVPRLLSYPRKET